MEETGFVERALGTDGMGDGVLMELGAGISKS
jgi:hypothetical protein